MAQAHAFISYVRENSDAVDMLVEELRSSAVSVWIDRNDISPGEYWKDAIHNAIADGAFFIACFSKELNERKESFMHGELRLAIDRLRNMPRERIWFIPVLLNETEIPSHRISSSETLREINAIRLFPDWQLGIKNILRAMKLEDPTVRRVLHLTNLVRYHERERLYATKQLIELGNAAAEAIPALITALRDEEETVRASAADALGEIGLPAVPALITALRDEEWEVRERAAEALEKIGPAASQAIPALITALRDEEDTVRASAADALGEIGLPAVPALITALRDEEGEVRAFATRALGEIGTPAVPDLITAYHDEEAAVRASAAIALGKIGTAFREPFPGARKTIHYKDDSNVDDDMRCIATEAFEQIGIPADGVVPILITALGHEEWIVRERAAEALGKVGPAASEAIPALIAALRRNYRDFGMIKKIAEALGEIGPAASEAVSDLIVAIRDLSQGIGDPGWEISKGEAREQLSDALGKIGPAAVPALMTALRDDEDEVRESAAGALGEIGPAASEAIPALNEAVQDTKSFVRESAARALMQIQMITA
ncbi:HEAT repeat-containing protein (plasmid) [Thioflavicoccus mobilis 8321]|uniref:HEAT repeat-containing protein n=1 Tax=Thioflavicoccus mobilis 8321 TaxID=765912 RepID=L0H2X2_9GAMM|nr:HEAT repeat domain-containing protein [Thioflavicoccus mobilis]AGA92417.1 HEAT repeat-containing protein [Thioflavicoccus mobilis 8321]